MAYDEEGNWVEDEDPYGGIHQEVGGLPGSEGSIPIDPGIFDAGWTPEFGDSTTVEGDSDNLPSHNPFEDAPYAGQSTPGEGSGGGGKTGGITSTLKKLFGSDIGKAGILSGLGGLLNNLTAQPGFQKKKGFTGSANPQRLMEEGTGNMRELLPMLRERAGSGQASDPYGLANFNPETPQGLEGSDQIMQLLKGLK